MVHSILKFGFMILFFSLLSCKKDSKPIIQDQMVIGVKEANAISSADFTPIDIEESLLCQSEKSIIFEGINVIALGKCFTINGISNQKFHYQTIKTLGTSLVTTSEGQAKVYYKGAIVKFTDNFTTVDSDLPDETEIVDINHEFYISVNFGNDKQYIGWIKLKVSIDHLIVIDYCYYEVIN